MKILEVVTIYGVNIVGEHLLENESSLILKFPIKTLYFPNPIDDSRSLTLLPFTNFTKVEKIELKKDDILLIEEVISEEKIKLYKQFISN